MTDEHDHGLIGAWLLDGHGGARRLDRSGVGAWQSNSGVLWLHLDRQDPGARRILTGVLGINVAGIPGAEFSQAFIIVCGLPVLVGLGQYCLFRRWKWF